MESLWTVDEVATLLSSRRVWVYKLVREGRIPYYHLERSLRFSPEEIRAWLEERRNKPWRRDKNRVRDASPG